MQYIIEYGVSIGIASVVICFLIYKFLKMRKNAKKGSSGGYPNTPPSNHDQIGIDPPQ